MCYLRQSRGYKPLWSDNSAVSGVGKTTASAATALHYARVGRRTSIISIDLTPSLSDIFEMEVGPTERPAPSVKNLHALEIDPGEVMRRWKSSGRRSIRRRWRWWTCPYGDGMTTIKLPLLPYEVKGIERLREMEGILFGSGGEN